MSDKTNSKGVLIMHVCGDLQLISLVNSVPGGNEEQILNLLVRKVTAFILYQDTTLILTTLPPKSNDK